MPAGTCDPATRGDAYNVLEMQVPVEGTDVSVLLTVRYGWDGVSTRETGCDGPLVNGGSGSNRWAVRGVNTGSVDVYAHTVRKNGQPASYRLAAGQTAAVTANQAANNGYALASDFGDLSFSANP